MSRRRTTPRNASSNRSGEPAGTLRVIGGRLRGQPIEYLGDPRTRPMKQRVREAAFNLIGSRVEGTHVLDLFAGTGALAWEAISRGALSATLMERHFPSARLVEKNARQLGVASLVQVLAGDTFFWMRTLDFARLAPAPERPWLVFCSPPYELYVSQPADMLQLIQLVADRAPAGSLLLVESDQRFDVGQLSCSLVWDIRHYAPAVLALADIVGRDRQCEDSVRSG